MTRQPSAIVLNGAPSQLGRWLRALGPGYARVDGRSLEELLAFAPRFGALIYFYNLQDEPEGDWTAFYLTDPTMVLASIEALDLTSVETEYLRAERRASATRAPTDRHAGLRDLFGILHGLGRRADLWLKGLATGRGSRAAERVRRELAAEVETRLGASLRRLEAYDRGAGSEEALGQTVGLDYRPFGAVWKLGRSVPDDSIYRSDSDAEGRETLRMDRALQPLRELFTSVSASLGALQSVTAEQLEESLETGDQAPQAALYVAFAQLFRTAQDTINTISTRYQRFYYHRVLREGRQGGVPDRVFLTFTLASGEDVLATSVPRGTLFPAGEDVDGNEILFELARSVAVSTAQLSEIRALRVVSGALYQPETSLDRSVDGSRELEISEANAEVPNGDEPSDDVPRLVLASVVLPEDEPTDGWITFGAAEEGTTDTEITEPASLGFALATPYLLLTGGGRSITLTVEYPESFESEVLKPQLDELAEATGLEPVVIWEMVLGSAFRPYFSTADGWFLFEGTYTATTPGFQLGTLQADDFIWVPWFALSLELSDTAPAVEGYDPETEETDTEGEEGSAPVTEDPEVVATNPAPGTPTLKLYLRQETVTLSGDRGTVEVYPLSLLAGLDVVGFDLAVGVDGLPVETLANTDGEIDPTSPFAVFGGIPTVGSYLQISHSEIFSKVPQSLTVGIRWFNLPPNSNGFQGWYRDYVLNLDGEPQADLFDNTTFLGAFRLRNPGTWWLQEPSKDCKGDPPAEVSVYLFRTDNDCDDPKPTTDGKLCTDSDFSLGACPSFAGVPPYYDPAESALRLVLTEPSYAFGNDLYALNVLKAVIDDLPDPVACQARCEGECAPLSEAATLLADCLTRCESEDNGDPYTACIEPCLEQCQDILLAGALLCILRCLSALRTLQPERKREWEATVRDARHQPRAARAQTLERVLRELGDRRGSATSQVGSSQDKDPGLCLNRCWPYLRGYSCISDCMNRCKTDAVIGTATYDKTCLTECLTICQEQLTEAYGTCVADCVTECSKQDGDLKYPNEPYLPQAEAVTLQYSASTTPATFYHLLPFGGYQAASIADQSSPPPLLPELPAPGNLYLGFTELIPPQVLTLLVQMTTADDPVAGVELPEVTWQVLAGNSWRTLETSEILVDTTGGLENTGLLELDLPRYDADDHTVAPEGYQWLRATVARDPGAFPRTLALTPHAGTAVWTPDEDAATPQTGEHLEQPIPAGAITSSVQDLADIESIDQPLASFGGRPPEDRRAYEIRLGERLRHKDRAILDWDYERLVLERFPAIWKVQALPARDLEGGDAPGHALVVVVPGPDLGEAMDSTVPRAPGEVLRQIQSYLEARTSPFVELRVVNPLYVRITVEANVEFRDDGEGGGSIGRLNDDLVDYLSPWFYDAARASKEGRYASQAAIAEFIRTRPYVQRLATIDFQYSPEREGLEWYFLTSARSHDITEVIHQDGGTSTNPPCTQEAQNV